MRLWSLHPSYLDSKGLVALWREGLLAQQVLAGKTKGYKNHPQLDRFKSHPDPLRAMAFYLSEVQREAEARGYQFNVQKIGPNFGPPAQIEVTRGQLKYEITHLIGKLKLRAPEYGKNVSTQKPKAHPLFKVVPGTIAAWEKT